MTTLERRIARRTKEHHDYRRKRLGFSWNRNREAWQNPCGVFRPASKNHDPRQFYGEEPVE